MMIIDKMLSFKSLLRLMPVKLWVAESQVLMNTLWMRLAFSWRRWGWWND